jgi:hypothetical protein
MRAIRGLGEVTLCTAQRRQMGKVAFVANPFTSRSNLFSQVSQAVAVLLGEWHVVFSSVPRPYPNCRTPQGQAIVILNRAKHCSSPPFPRVPGVRSYIERSMFVIRVSYIGNQDAKCRRPSTKRTSVCSATRATGPKVSARQRLYAWHFHC